MLTNSPICAAVSCLRDVHFGPLILEVATLFYILPEPLVRSTYLVFMMQNYCHVLTLTLEMLHFDWPLHFKGLSFPRILEAFFQVLPTAILTAVEVCMEQTDPRELADLVGDTNKLVNNRVKSAGTKSTTTTTTTTEEPKFANECIPLTEASVHFLVRLMDAVKKPI